MQQRKAELQITIACLIFVASGVLCGIAHAYATSRRGYAAIGGEHALMALPLIIYAARGIARGIRKLWRSAMNELEERVP